MHAPPYGLQKSVVRITLLKNRFVYHLIDYDPSQS